MDDETLEIILALVHRHTGITMNKGKKTLLEGRLRRRLQALGFDCYPQYLDYLARNPDETQNFVNLVTTNETSFFRTQRVWDYFTKKFLPAWAKEHPQETLRVWSAAASSGEEAYSVAISCEEFRKSVPGFTYEIVGTDIDTEVLKIAEKAGYCGRSINALRAGNPALFEKYFLPEGDGFRVADLARRKVSFLPHNLFKPFSRHDLFDVTFLRNVLIYFEKQDQEEVIRLVSRASKDKGLLLIGESESLGSLKTPFKFKEPLVYENVRDGVTQSDRAA